MMMMMVETARMIVYAMAKKKERKNGMSCSSKLYSLHIAP